LVIAPQWIGDAVMTEPLLRRLHARGEQLTVAALPLVADVYRAMPQVHAVMELPFVRGQLQWRERSRLARQWQGHFDTAYVLPNSLKSALLPFMAHIPRRVGYLGEARIGVLTHRLKNPSRKGPMVAFYSALSGEPQAANALLPSTGLQAPPTAPQGAVLAAMSEEPRLQVNAAAQQVTLAHWGMQPQRYTVIAPGAEYGPAKRWPLSYFAELARQWPGHLLLLGSAKDAEACAHIAAAAPERCTNLAGQTTLAQALHLVGAAQQLLSNDSGLMHVAAALAVPQVALFGSSSPHHTPPLNPRARVIWLKDDPDYQPPLDCAPCFARECPLGHTRCLVDIPVARVRAALAALLPAGPGKPTIG